MALQVTALTDTCNAIARQVRERFRNLTIHYIIHHEGRRAEALGMTGHELLYHPASETALSLLTNAREEEESALIGVAVASQNMFLGLASRDSLLALCTINADQYDNLKEARRHAYHLAWHAIDALDYHSDPDNRNGPREVVIRKRNVLDMAGANLQADTFASVMCVLQGDRETVQKLAVARGNASLQARSSHSPERYPFVMAGEATGLVLEQIRRKSNPKKKYIDIALKAARQIARTFDEDSLRQWLAFSEPAQDMAWRGYTPAQILGAAINTSDNTMVRSTAYLVSEVIGIAPASALDIRYSPFADDSFNEKLHQKAIDSIFEDVIAAGLRLNSADPFIEAANKQNQKLLEGQVVGWCAGALQSSARAFALALESGREAESAARREFNDERGKTTWDGLKDLGRKIIGSYRQNKPLTMAGLAAATGKDQLPMAMRKSIEMTLKDPSMQKAVPSAPRAAPAAKPGIAPAAPGYGPSMGPGGGKMGGGTLVRTRPATAQKTGDTGDTRTGDTGQ